MRGIRRGTSADEVLQQGTPGGQKVVGPSGGGGAAPRPVANPGGGDKTLQGPEKKKLNRGFEF